MKLELISFKLCPFVQRSIIALRHKGLPYSVTYVDLEDPPAWFLAISPMGRVPALRVDDDTVLFESAIINEFIDDVTPGSLRPGDPLRLAQNRGWIQFGEQCLFDQYHWMTAATEEDFENAEHKLRVNLRKLEAALGEGPYFNGEEFSLVDCAYAPLWMRYARLASRHSPFERDEFPRLAAWSDALLSLEAVQGSVPEDFDTLLTDYIRSHGAHAGAVLGGAPRPI